MIILLLLFLIPVLLILHYNGEKFSNDLDRSELFFNIGVFCMGYIMGYLIIKQCLVIGVGPDESFGRLLLENFIFLSSLCSVKLLFFYKKRQHLEDEVSGKE